MATTIQAFSQVSVYDLTDVGSFNSYLTSNQPNGVIYNPNTITGSYSPNWATSNLIITPVITYRGNPLSLTATGLSITYTRQEGSDTATSLTTGETVSNGVLTVSQNKLAGIVSGQLTYICQITYTDPDVNVPITTQSSLTYNLLTMAPEAKQATITGENAFLYDANRNVIGTGTITLTADLKNCEISQWQYRNSNGQFIPYPTTPNNQITLSVRHDESVIWLNGKTAVIKLTTNDPNVYDIAQIVKISDGAAGDSVITIILTNENHILPCNTDGSVITWNGAATEIHIYEGDTETTSQWTITANSGNGLTGSYDPVTHIYTPSALTEEASYADFTATRTGYSTLNKRYNILKQTKPNAGENAVLYQLVPSCYNINLNSSGNFTPASITFMSNKIDGNTKSLYSCRFVINESIDNGSTFITKYTSNTDESSKTFSPSSRSVNLIQCLLYEAGATTQLLDSQTILITKDGAAGVPGTDGLSLGLGNYSDLIPCTTAGNSVVQRDIAIPFYAYKGVTRVPVTATVGTLPTGVTVNSNSAGTDSSDGMLILRVAEGATFGNSATLTGDISITLTADGKFVGYKYTWTKSKAAEDPVDSVLLQLYSEDGGYVKNGKNTVIKAMVYSGITDVTNSGTYVWKQFRNGSYTEISGQTNSSILITPSMVTDQMWLKCEATYQGNVYSSFYTVDDESDPIQATTYATISEFKNGQGFGAIYTRLYQAGTEVDPIKSTTFSATAPTSPQENDYYYYLDTINKRCVLKKYNGSEWTNAANVDSYEYLYYRIDGSGESLDITTPWKTGRCQYVDPSVINGHMQFICEVNKPN